jgi:hypothetical protein
VYDTQTRSAPGNVSPEASDYTDDVDSSGSFSTGAFLLQLSSLVPETQYFMRAFAQNSEGYAYGDEVNFTTTLRRR